MDTLVADRTDSSGIRWAAEMIAPLCDGGVGTPASFVSKSFRLESVGGSVLLRISALGLYRAFINGKRVGQDLLTPGWTAYDKRLSYQSYEVGNLLTEGENHIEIWLADGWMRSQMMWGNPPIFNTWGDKIAAIAELRANDATGPVLLSTDATWSSGELPVRKSGIYFGEIFDARVEPVTTAGTAALEFDYRRLIPHEVTPVRELEPLKPVASWVDGSGNTIHDFGQNVGGYVSFEVTGQPGSRVRVDHAEILDKDGNFYNGNFRTAEAVLEYTLRGSGVETYAPYFTFQGFRYARVSIEGAAEIVSIRSVPITSVTAIKAGFTSANPLVDRLVQNTIWSQRGNFIEVPTDCPQRDERLGWTGDAQVFAGTASYLADAQDFFRKWVRDVMADQREDGAIPHVSPDPTRMAPNIHPNFFGSTGWGDAIAIVPWELYLHYADEAFLKETLPAMVRWVDYVWSISDGPIVRPPRAKTKGFTFGDWLQPSGPSAKPLPTIGDSAAATIYLFITASLVARIATTTGAASIAERMADLAARVKAAFVHEFITPSGRLVYDDQTSYALAILHDLIPPDKLDAAKHYFIESIERTSGRIGTGFIGTPALLPALVKIGEPEIAADVFLQEGVPGWLYQVRMGATTIWERWDAIAPDGSIYNPRMNSYNHYAYGSVCQWLFESVAGFRPDPERPGFANIIFKPTIVPRLSPVKAHHDSRRGRISAGWTVTGEAVRYEIEIPPHSAGLFEPSPAYRDIVVDTEPQAGSGGKIRLAPGKHVITFSYSAPAGLGSDSADPNALAP